MDEVCKRVLVLAWVDWGRRQAAAAAVRAVGETGFECCVGLCEGCWCGDRGPGGAGVAESADIGDGA